MRILLAEDDEVLAQFFVELFTDEGHHVTRVRSVQEARRLAQAGPWHAVLVDSFSPSYREPLPTDFAVLQELSSAAPVMVVTARHWAARFTAADLGVAALVRKPFELDELLGTLRRLR